MSEKEASKETQDVVEIANYIVRHMSGIDKNIQELAVRAALQLYAEKNNKGYLPLGSDRS